MSEPIPAPNPPAAPGTPRPSLRGLANNVMTRMGFISVVFWGAVLAFFIFRDVTSNAFEEHPYAGLLIYLLLPGLFSLSVVFALTGMFFKWRRIKTHPEEAGNTMILRPIKKSVWGAGLAATLAWLILSGFGAYKSYHATASTGFCGSACHVMEPEHVAYSHSVHDKVSCPQCHIGTGLQSTIQAKTNGIKQLYEVATHSYHTPIKTPIANERPTQGTCKQCHAPERMKGEVTRVFTHFSGDKDNTPTRFKLLIDISGGKGVHWHVGENNQVQFYASDDARQDIPYVRMVKDGKVQEYMTAKFNRADIKDESKLRTMTCTDCHNRIGHNFKTPSKALDEALDNGLISTAIPKIKSIALKAIDKKFDFTAMEAEAKTAGKKFDPKEAAVSAINGELDQYYASVPITPEGLAALPAAKNAIDAVYRDNFFPDQNVDYRGFNDNLGHFDFKGCDRCHDNKHTSEDKKVVLERKCDKCHTLIGQATGAEEIKKMTLGAVEFKHPSDDPVNLKRACTGCHAAKKIEEPNAKAGGETAPKKE